MSSNNKKPFGNHQAEEAFDHHENGEEDVSNKRHNHHCSPDDFEPEMTIYHGSNCQNHHEEEHHEDRKCECCCGCCCPFSPIPIDECCSICEQQMKFVLEQLIRLYPGRIFEFTLEDGVTAIGIPDLIITEENKGLVRINCVVLGVRFIEYVSICKIVSIKLIIAIYNNDIRYLPSPISPSCCGCEESIRSVLPVGAPVLITAGGENLGPSIVRANHVGIVVLRTGANLQFVSTCKIDKIKTILLAEVDAAALTPEG